MSLPSLRDDAGRNAFSLLPIAAMNNYGRPSRTRTRAIASPIPLLLPVTNARLPCSCKSMRRCLSCATAQVNPMRYAAGMTRTHKSVGYSPKSKSSVSKNVRDCSPEAAAEAFELLEGRWKLVIYSHLFGREGATSPVMRFSELERAIPNVSQKMLIQQLRGLERDGIVQRTIHPQVPPKVEYQLTSVGEALRPTLRALLDWAALSKRRDSD